MLTRRKLVLGAALAVLVPAAPALAAPDPLLADILYGVSDALIRDYIYRNYEYGRWDGRYWWYRGNRYTPATYRRFWIDDYYRHYPPPPPAHRPPPGHRPPPLRPPHFAGGRPPGGPGPRPPQPPHGPGPHFPSGCGPEPHPRTPDGLDSGSRIRIDKRSVANYHSRHGGVKWQAGHPQWLPKPPPQTGDGSI